MAETIIDYDIAFALTASNLAAIVKAEIKKGWQPFGNLIITTRSVVKNGVTDEETTLMQPMVLYSHPNS